METLRPESVAHSAGKEMDYLAACKKAVEWAEARNFTGYSKFDALNSPLLHWIAGRRRLLRAGFIYAVSRAPLNIRPVLGVRKRQNPNGLALFALAYFNLYRIHADQAYLTKGLELLKVLEPLSQVSRYSGHCWGYCHDWQDKKFFAPKYEPNTVVTVFVAHAFLDGYRLTKDARLLEIARSSADFLRRDLKITINTSDMRAYSYTPFDNWTAPNTSALIAGLMASLYQSTGEDELREKARLIANFLLSRQTDYGAWFHGEPPESSHRKHDNYHIAFILRSLQQVYEALGDTRVEAAYKQGLDFYKRELFMSNGAPKWEPDMQYPVDIISCSQGILVFAKADVLGDEWLKESERVADWTLKNMWHKSGRFYFQRDRFWTRRYTLMRWCQAWMSYALSELALAKSGELPARSVTRV